ncbi:hypothetical protein EPI10_025310 [Gossypium australe]|uniref:Uncharacterized protein n=1 Tax=Gossypium australe TaxID=47621 RepID=A0A5B6W1M1_9ROSI|nr:hypothetical protein EPI10_025310 [Gossypium australe]
MENSLNFDVVSSLPEVNDGGGDREIANRNTKKVRFKNVNDEEITDVLVESSSGPTISWNDKLLGINSGALDKKGLDFFWYFSERIQQILFKEMEFTVVLKLLGRNIGMGHFIVVLVAYGILLSPSISWT